MTSAAPSTGLLSLALRPLNEDTQQLACRWRGCSEAARLFCPQSLYDHLCQSHASTAYNALAQNASDGTSGSESGENGEGVACLWDGCQYRCKSKKRHHMNSHLRSHVPLSPFQCQICMVTFKWKSDLTKHLKRQHGVTSALSSAISPEGDLIDPGSVQPDEAEYISLLGENVGTHFGQFANQENAARLAKQNKSLAVFQHFVQAIRDGRLRPDLGDPVLVMWTEELSNMDSEVLKQLLAKDPSAMHVIENFLGTLHNTSGYSTSTGEPMSPIAMGGLAFLGNRDASPSMSADENSIASSPAADLFSTSVPLAQSLDSNPSDGSALFLDQKNATALAGANPFVSTTTENSAAVVAASLAAASASASPMLYDNFSQSIPQQQTAFQQQPGFPGSGMLFGQSVDNISYGLSSPLQSEGDRSVEAQLSASNQLDTTNFGWLANGEFTQSIEATMGVQPSEIFGGTDSNVQSPTFSPNLPEDPVSNRPLWAQQLANNEVGDGMSADERSLRRVQSTPMFDNALQRPVIRTPGSPSMLRPMRSTELRGRMVSPPRSLDRSVRSHSSTSSILRASQSVDALRIQAQAAAAAAAQAGDSSNNSVTGKTDSNIGLGNIGVPISAASMVTDKRARARVDLLLRRMQQLSLRNQMGGAGIGGQIKFKPSVERIRWQGQ